jgi:hypothetical protein
MMKQENYLDLKDATGNDAACGSANIKQKKGLLPHIVPVSRVSVASGVAGVLLALVLVVLGGLLLQRPAAPALAAPVASTNGVSADGADLPLQQVQAMSNTITIIKRTIPITTSEVFTFTSNLSDAPFTLRNGEYRTFSGLQQGEYAFSEEPMPGWELSVSCEGGSYQEVQSGVEVFLEEEGQNIVCTFTNRQHPATITISKVISPSTQAPPFMFDFAGDLGEFQLADQEQKTFEVATGNYTVTEMVPPGWDVDVTCRRKSEPVNNGDGVKISINADEEVACTFVNTPANLPAITIVKTTDPVTEGVDFDFTLTDSQGEQTDFSLSPGEIQTFTDLQTLPYTITEKATEGWVLGYMYCNGGEYSPVQNGAVVMPSGDQHVVCAFLNAQKSNITLVKETYPDGATEPFTFTDHLQNTFVLHDGESKTYAGLGPVEGGYLFTETAPDGWQLGDVVCEGAEYEQTDNGIVVFPIPGQDAVCTFLNKREVSAITVVEETNPDDPTRSFSYTLQAASGPGKPTAFSLKDDESNTLEVTPGDYTLTVADAEGWLPPEILCRPGGGTQIIDNGVQIALKGNQHLICTFTHAKPPKITVVKKLTRPFSTTDSFTFTLSGPTGQATDFSLMGGESQTFDVQEGLYTIFESMQPEGWVPVDMTCDTEYNPAGPSGAAVSVENGDHVTCVFTNAPGGFVKIIKETDPSGAPDRFFFTASNNENFVLHDGEEHTLMGLHPGTHTIAEAAPPGWSVKDIVCEGGEYMVEGNEVSVVVENYGQQMSCTFTNVPEEPAGSRITVIKKTEPMTATDSFTFTGGLGEFHLKGGESKIFVVEPGTYNIFEQLPAGWEAADVTCNDPRTHIIGNEAVTVFLEENEHVTCIFTNVKKGSRITVIKKTEPMTATDSFTFTGSLGTFKLPAGRSKTFEVDPGTYNIFEQLPEGWDATGVDCDDPRTQIIGNEAATVFLEENEHVTCVFTNTQRSSITVVKQTYPDGATDSFTFTGSLDNFTLSDDQSTRFDNLPPGSYRFSEELPDGWSLADIKCMGSAHNVNLDAQNVSLDLKPGEHAVCTFTNKQDNGITIIKKTIPPRATQEFSFTGSLGNFSLSDGKSRTVSNLPPGEYTVNEFVPDGWTLDRVECDGSNQRTDRGTVVMLEEGDHVVCTFINEQDGSITIEKQTYPDGTTHVFSFTGQLGEFGLSDGQSKTHEGLEPGEYFVGEMVPDGWSLDRVMCEGGMGKPEGEGVVVQLAPGKHVHCTFVNTQHNAITVIKKTYPEDATQPFSFTGDLGEFRLSNGEGYTLFDLAAGDYEINEVVPDGWDLDRVECEGDSQRTDRGVRVSLEDGEHVVCTFINMQRSSITIVKETYPNGAAQEFPFTGSLGEFSLSDGGSKTVDGLKAGEEYSVSEIVPDGWSLANITCEGGESKVVRNRVMAQPGPGEHITCTFLNTQDNGITIVKETYPANADLLFTFTGDLGNFELSDGQSKTETNLTAGEYVITEQVPDGWYLADIQCEGTSTMTSTSVTVRLKQGEHVVCTFVNKQYGSITIAKATEPMTTTAGFSFRSTMGTFSLGDGESRTLDNLKAGSFSFTEIVSPGWYLEKVECTGDKANHMVNGNTVEVMLEPGQDITCTFVNHRRGSMTIVKETDPEDTQQSFRFGGNLGIFALADGESKLFDNLKAGDYNVTEEMAAGWRLDSVVCEGGESTSVKQGATIHLKPGQDIVCTFLNKEGEGGPGTITIVKETIPSTATGSFTFTGSLGDFALGAGESKTFDNLDAGSYPIAEVVPRRWVLRDMTCSDDNSQASGNTEMTISLETSEHVTCTFTNKSIADLLDEKSPDVVEMDSIARRVKIGAKATYRLFLRNPGNQPHTFVVEGSGNQWDTEATIATSPTANLDIFTGTEATVEPGGEVPVDIMVTVPETASAGDSDTVIVAIGLQDGEPDKRAEFSLTTTAGDLALYLPIINK